MNKGILVISLDFELMWGIIDVLTKSGYGMTNVKNVPEVVRRMIALFEKYDVHATFATVGMIMYQDAQSLLEDMPEVRPSYVNTKMSPYENEYIPKISAEEEVLFFQPELVKEISTHEGMEIGTHSFCHYYCRAEGQNVKQFDADIAKALEVAEKKGYEIKSIVFPRNQVSDEYLKICAENGIKSYRGNAPKYFGESKSRIEAVKNRVCRLLDAYVNIGGNSGFPYSDLQSSNGILNIRASRMLRPYSPKLSILEPLRLSRIRKEMMHAAKYGELYHIWWHPHNFGVDMDKNLEFLEKLLIHYKYCHQKYGMVSMNMQEVAELVNDRME